MLDSTEVGIKLVNIFCYHFIKILGDEAIHGNDSSWSLDCSTVIRVKTLHISSPILAAKSPFFYKVNALT